MGHSPGGATRPIPVLRGVRLLGVLPALRRDPLAVFAAARRLGAVVRLAAPLRRPLLLLADPAGIRHVLQENAANYRRTPFHDRLKVVLGEGLVTSEGELWRRQRRLLQPAFRAERIRAFTAPFGQAAAGLAAAWEGAEGEVVEVTEAMSALALDIAVRCMFGAEEGVDHAAIAAAVQVAQDWVSARFWSLAPGWAERLPTPANRRFRAALAVLDGALARIVAARVARGEAGADLLGLLLAAQGEGDARQVRDEAMTMLLAGHETSAAALSWVWHLLAQHPEVAEAVRAEAALVLGGRLPEPADLARLELTGAVVQEAMRLYPPVGWFGRLAAGPDRIGGHDIPAGSLLLLSPWLVQRDPALWPDPLRFDPGRFLGRRPSPYAYFPFGGGPRTCIGNHFAMQEMVAILAVLVPRVRLEHASAAPVRAQLLVTLRPAGGLRMRIRRR